MHPARLAAAIRVALVALALAATQSPTLAETPLEAEARAALTRVFDALATGDPEKVRPLLAPEFQIVRASGAAYEKESYLALSIPKIESKPAFRDLVVTRNGDIVVTRLMIEIEEYLDGKKAESRSQQLIVFRVTPDGWQVVASANFAKLAN